jgi:hydroxyacylglutathione hydrolase
MTQQHLGEFGDFSLSVVVTSPPWYENCYLVHHRPSGKLVVVDPGGDADVILAAIAAEGATPQAIWLTHGHPDHLGAAKAIEQAMGIATHAHSEEIPVISGAAKLSRSFNGQPIEGPGDVRQFDGEPTLDVGGAPVRVIFTPGHTPGGVCFDFGEFILTGDTLFQGAVGRTDLPGGSERTLWASITRFLGMVEGDDVALLPGHGSGWTAADARRWWKTMV